ncbi:MAG: hypothetical protein KPEEDBHJ_00436 [Anaerolineales bacterium]|nr:hypothetical protein [Anaerolineales bacterium]
MDSEIEIKGFWWLPESPDKQVSGTLSFSPGEPIVLELMGALNIAGDKILTLRDFINPSIIHGSSLGGKPVTLERCLQIGGTAGLTGISTTRFTAKFAYEGVHFPSEKDIKFRGLTIEYFNLDEWFSKNAFSQQSPKPGTEIVTYEQPSPIKTIVGDYHIDFVSLGPNSSMDSFTYVKLSQKAGVNIWSDTDKSIDEFLPLMRHIQNFLSLAMSKPTFVTDVTGNTELAKESNPAFYYPVKMYYPANGLKTGSSKAHYFEMLFTLPAVEDQLEKILNDWINKAEIIKPVYDLYFSALYNPSIYQEFHFLSLAQAIETYHRQIYGGKYQPDEAFENGLYKILVSAIPADVDSGFRSSLKQGKLKFANEYSFRKRLQLLGEHLSERLAIDFLSDKKLRDIFAEQVSDTRNYFTHYPPELKEKAVKSGQEFHDLISKLRLVLQICLLEELGFPFDKISEIFKKNREYKIYFS